MQHIAEETLDAYVFDQAPLGEQDAAHLAVCSVCRTTLETLRLLATEMSIARDSEPPPAIRARAYRLFPRIQQQPSWLTQMVQRLHAQLLWDSRQQLAVQGLRNTGLDRYHLLYTTERIEVELSIQPLAAGLNLEGDLLPLDQNEHLAPALVHLQPTDPNAAPYEIRSDPAGHFRIQGVAPGHYTLLITPPSGALLEIDGLEFA